MMRVILNGNGATQLWDLVKHFIKPELLEDETIDAELKDVEEVYKREGLAMYTGSLRLVPLVILSGVQIQIRYGSHLQRIA